MTTPKLGGRARLVVSFLAGILIALLAITIVLLVIRPGSPAAQPPAPPPTSSASPSIDPDAGDYEHDHDTANDEKPQWEPVVLGFAKNFTNTGDKNAKQWRNRLAPFVAPAVRDQLAGVDITRVPKGAYDSYEILTPGSYQIAAKVTYREGWALVLYVTSDGREWRLTGYDRWEE